MQSLKHSFKKVSVSHAQLAHFSTLAKEKHMLLILNFSTLTFITNARTTMPFARLQSQMVCTQSEPAEIPQHMFVKILIQVRGDRNRRTSRTTLRTPSGSRGPLVDFCREIPQGPNPWFHVFPPRPNSRGFMSIDVIRLQKRSTDSHTTCDTSLLSCLLREGMKNQLPSVPSNV